MRVVTPISPEWPPVHPVTDAQRAKEYLLKAAAAGVVAAKDRMAALEQNAH